MKRADQSPSIWGETRVKRFAHLVVLNLPTLCLAMFLALLPSSPTSAHTPQQPPHQSFGEGDLKLESGEMIRDFSISYVTHGKLNEKKSNTTLMVTAPGGNPHPL